MKNESELREKLLGLEKVTPELEAKYRSEMKSILERPLTPFTRVGSILGIFMGIGFFLVFGYVAVSVTWLAPGFPAVWRIMFAVGALFGLAFAILSFIIVKRGSIGLKLWRNETLKQLRTIHPVEAGLAWVFCVLIMVACLITGNEMEDAVRGNQMILGGIVAMVLFAIPILIMSSATQSEVLFRERFLRLELQLAELRDLVAGQRDDSPQDGEER